MSGFSVGWLALIFAMTIEGSRVGALLVAFGRFIVWFAWNRAKQWGHFRCLPFSGTSGKGARTGPFPVGLESVAVGSKCRKTGVTLTSITVRPTPDPHVPVENRNFDEARRS